MLDKDYLAVVEIVPGGESHICLADSGRCRSCETKPCLRLCPSGVFVWDELAEKAEVSWWRCLECGACQIACPSNIEFRYPQGGFGVSNRF